MALTRQHATLKVGAALIIIGGMLVLAMELTYKTQSPVYTVLRWVQPHSTQLQRHTAIHRQVLRPSSAKVELLTPYHGQQPKITLLDYEPITINDNMSVVDLHDHIISIAKQQQAICGDAQLYGSKVDGGWPVCRVPPYTPTPPCTVYSFGIHYDWTFDDAYHKAHGCTIRTFDPSMGKTKAHEHSPGVFFYPDGLSDKNEKSRGWKLYSYKQLLERFNDTTRIIPYLKFDIETYEWRVLHNLIADGVLRNVMQLSFEIHLNNPIYGKVKNRLKNFFYAVKKIEDLGFRRWFFHHRLNGNPFQCDQSFININFMDSHSMPGRKPEGHRKVPSKPGMGPL